VRTEDGVNPLAAATKVDSHPTEQDARALLREEANDVVSGRGSTRRPFAGLIG